MGSLNRPQEIALSYYVKNRYVWDLGAGHLGWASALTKAFGARKVRAVDLLYRNRTENYLNNNRDWQKCAPPKVEIDARSFAELVQTGPVHYEVVFVSWPHNTWGRTMGIEHLVNRAEVVIYLGSNFDGISCGSPSFWDMLVQRKVLCTLPSRTNTLTVYGEALPFARQRPLLPDEAAARDIDNYHNTPAWFP